MADTDSPLDAIDRTVLAQMTADLDPEMACILVGAFIDELEGRIPTIEAALARKDMATLAFQAHAVKSTAGTYGADQLYRASTATERVCREGDPAVALARCRDLPPLIRRAAAGLRLWVAEVRTQESGIGDR